MVLRAVLMKSGLVSINTARQNISKIAVLVNTDRQARSLNVVGTNEVNAVNSTVNAAGTNEVNVVGGKTSIELLYDPNMPALEDD
ncbi:hypothetical protein Tco_1192734, partial [Tanacetum coccineum]